LTIDAGPQPFKSWSVSAVAFDDAHQRRERSPTWRAADDLNGAIGQREPIVAVPRRHDADADMTRAPQKLGKLSRIRHQFGPPSA
jgi:hypothetical protein